MSQGTTKGVPIDIDSTFTANSDAVVPSQKAVKTGLSTFKTANFLDATSSIQTQINAKQLTTPIYNTPQDVANLQLWFDASKAMYTTSYGAVISTLGQSIGVLPDRSGNGRFGTASATQPTYDPTGMNGLPTINFNGNSNFTTASFLDNTFDNGFTCLYVAKGVSGAGNKVIIGTTNNSIWVENNDTAKTIGGHYGGLTGASGLVSNYTKLDGIGFVHYNKSVNQIFSSFDKLFKGTATSSLDSSQSAPRIAVTGSITTFTGLVKIGDLVAGGFAFGGQVSEVLLFNRALSDIELTQMTDYLLQKWNYVKKTIICGGNSLTSGSGSTGGVNQNMSTTGNNYPCRLWNALGSASYDVRTDSYAGRTLSQMITETPVFSDLLYFKNASPRNIFIVWEVTNQLTQKQSADGAYDLLKKYCLARKAIGFKVVVCTCITRGDTIYGGFQIDRAYVNNLIKANYLTFADYIVDLDADTRLQNFNNATYFNADKIHLTDAGYQVVSDLIYPIIIGI